jgi:tramtrack
METNDEDSEKATDNPQHQPQIRVSTFATQSGPANLVNVIQQLQQKHKDANNADDDDGKKDKITMWIKKDNSHSKNSPILMTDIRANSIEISPNSSLNSPSSGSGQKSLRRRIRRKHNSPDDQAEALTEMSVRGLNLFRYASIQDGVYKCTECAKESVQKTFKNKYSFQRHAFLYHEGTQRKVFPCPVCRKEFSRPDKMKNHMKMTHECYMPKECKFPLPLIIAGSSQSSVNNNILNLATTQ